MKNSKITNNKIFLGLTTLPSVLIIFFTTIGIASAFPLRHHNTNQQSVLRDPHQSRIDVWQDMSKNFRISHQTQRNQVQQQIRWIKKNKTLFNKASTQSEHFIYFVSNQVKNRNMPSELALLPMIESGYDPYAKSWVGASGIWQFMPRTAREMGVKQNWWYDGRRDVIKSTDAALDYLQSLNKTFNGDWLHTLAAYNAGAGTVKRAIRINKKQGKSTDFWSLNLPKQTKSYVPRLLAMAEVVQNPSQYNVELPKIKNQPYFETINVGQQIDLSVAAKMADISMEELYALNPGFTQWATAPNGPHQLIFPNDKAKLFKANLAQANGKKLIQKDAPEVKRISYQVKDGNTLSGIAEKFHVSAKELLELNNLDNINKLRAGMNLTIEDHVVSNKPQNPRVANQQQNSRPKHYTVRRGDSLSTIAIRHSSKVTTIKRANNLRSNNIRVGQQLVIPTKGRQYVSLDEDKQQALYYKVKSGDALGKIAKRYNVSVNELQRWNRIKSTRLIKPGQELVIRRS